MIQMLQPAGIAEINFPGRQSDKRLGRLSRRDGGQRMPAMCPIAKFLIQEFLSCSQSCLISKCYDVKEHNSMQRNYSLPSCSIVAGWS
jgi:hypothetical protein